MLTKVDSESANEESLALSEIFWVYAGEMVDIGEKTINAKVTLIMWV